MVSGTGVVSLRTRSLRPSVCTDADDDSKESKRKPTKLWIMIIKDWSKEELLMLKKIENQRIELICLRKELQDLQDDYEVDSISGASHTGWTSTDNEEGTINGWEG